MPHAGLAADGGGRPGQSASRPGTLRDPHRHFNLDGLDEKKLANHAVGDTLVRVLPHFDVIALQGIRAKSRGLLVHLVEQINATGRSYDFATDAAADRDGLAQYNALLFDRASVEVDRSTVRFVEDPAGRFRYKPLVAQFRVRGPPVAEAFTFMLIDVQVDPTAWRRSWTCWPPSSAPCATTPRRGRLHPPGRPGGRPPSTWANWGGCPI